MASGLSLDGKTRLDETGGDGLDGRTQDETSEDGLDGRTREHLNVNSPRKKTQTTSFAQPAPNHLITQVNVEDEERRKKKLSEAGPVAAKKRERETRDDHEKPCTEPPSCLACRTCFTCFFKAPAGVSTVGDEPEGEENQNLASSSSETGQGDQLQNSTTASTASPQEDSEDSLLTSCSESTATKLLPAISEADYDRKCLVLDLDETLVHSSFQHTQCTFSLLLDISGTEYEVYVKKRPFVDEFITECAKWFEVVVFTASMSDYANPVIDRIDQAGVIKHRLFRESCVLFDGQFYVKDLSRLGRKLEDCIIIDNSTLSYMFNPTNAIGCTSWLGDETDTELLDLLPVLQHLRTTPDVRDVLNGNIQDCKWLIAEYGQMNHGTMKPNTRCF